MAEDVKQVVTIRLAGYELYALEQLAALILPANARTSWPHCKNHGNWRSRRSAWQPCPSPLAVIGIGLPKRGSPASPCHWAMLRYRTRCANCPPIPRNGQRSSACFRPGTETWPNWRSTWTSKYCPTIRHSCPHCAWRLAACHRRINKKTMRPLGSPSGKSGFRRTKTRRSTARPAGPCVNGRSTMGRYDYLGFRVARSSSVQ